MSGEEDDENELLNELLDEEDDELPDDLLELNSAFITKILEVLNLDEASTKEKEVELNILLDTLAFVFHEEDQDEDGEINIEELGVLFEKIGRRRPTPEAMLELVEKVGGDTEAGEIRYREFVNIMLLERGVTFESIDNLGDIDTRVARQSVAFFGGLKLLTKLVGGGDDEPELSPGEEAEARIQLIRLGQIRVKAKVVNNVIKIHIREAQGLRAPIRGLPSPFAKCHVEPDNGKSVSVKTTELAGTANPIWKEDLELPLPDTIEAVRLCVTVLHRDTSTTAQLMNMGIGLIGGNKDVHVGLVSFPLSEVAANGIDGWFRLLDEKDGGQVAVPLKKFRVSHRIVSSTAERPAVIEDYIFGKLLGEGAYGKVYLAQEDTTKEVYAVKVLSKVAMMEMDHDMALIERQALTIHPSSPFIAQLKASFQTEAYVFMVLEFFHGGDLEGHMTKDGERRAFSPEVVRYVSAQILLGIWHLHRSGYMYRDLKPANIMIDRKGMTKISDFGLSKLVGPKGRTDTFVGTPNYMAPEVVRNSPDYEGNENRSREQYGMEIDFWSLGVMIKEMLTGKLPWEGAEQRGNSTIFRKILDEPIVAGPLPRGMKREWVKKCTGVISRFLDRDATKRLCSEADVRSDEFFKGFRWEELEKLRMEPPGRIFIPDLDRFYFVPAGDGMVKLDPVSEDDLADINRHKHFFSGFDYVPGTVEERSIEEDSAGG